MKTLENYIPEHIEPVIQARYKGLPTRLFEGKTFDEIKKIIHQKFVTSNEKIIVPRKLDAAEIGTLRSNYPELLEVKLPKLKEEQREIVEQAESAIKQAKQEIINAHDRVTAVLTQLSDISMLVSAGTKDMTLEQPQCYCFVAHGHYLYYAWVKEEFILVKVQKIIDNGESNSLFTQGEQNAAAFKEQLGIDLLQVFDERKAYAQIDAEAYESQIEEELSQTNEE